MGEGAFGAGGGFAASGRLRGGGEEHEHCIIIVVCGFRGMFLCGGTASLLKAHGPRAGFIASLPYLMRRNLPTAFCVHAHTQIIPYYYVIIELRGVSHTVAFARLSQVSASNARMGKLPSMSRVQLSFRRRGSTAEEATQVHYTVVQGAVLLLFLFVVVVVVVVDGGDTAGVALALVLWVLVA